MKTTFLKKLTDSYKRNFKFVKDDQLNIAEKQNKSLFIVLCLFLVISSGLLIAGLVSSKFTLSNFYFWSFYVAHVCIAFFNLIFLLALRGKWSNYYIKSIPVYVMNICYLAVNLWDLYQGGFVVTSYMVFAVHCIVCCLLFEMNPIIWTGLVISMVIGYGIKKVDFYPYLNFSIFALAAIALSWWKRFSKVKSLEYLRNLDLEKKKNEKLLLNILPEKIVQELKETGTTVPEKFESVSILFTDFVSFTKTSQSLSPEFLIAELNEIFTEFDRISEKHDCQRIKTIGDSYFAVCGLPERCNDHAEKIVLCAKELVSYLEKRNETAEIKWRMRIGINSGSVTAGVVGTKKYLYDIFGDAVNTASRMESNSEPMKINVSESTKNLLEGKFSFQQRDSVEVKGKGQMTMYFVD